MRKRRATKRDILADPIYNSKVIAKLINIAEPGTIDERVITKDPKMIIIIII